MSFDSILQLPIGWAYLALFVIVMCRANATYWAGRLMIAGGRRSERMHRLFTGSTMVRAEHFTARWGLLAVPLSFLTIGVQTAVNLSAGALQMPLARYLPAVTLGCLMWALVYATVGLAAIHAVLLGLGRSPWALAALAVAALLMAGVAWFHRRHTHRQIPVSAAVEASER